MGTEKQRKKTTKRMYLVTALVEVVDEAGLLKLGKKHSFEMLYETEEEKNAPYTVKDALLDVAFPRVILRDGSVDVNFSRVEDCTEEPDQTHACVERFCGHFSGARPAGSK